MGGPKGGGGGAVGGGPPPSTDPELLEAPKAAEKFFGLNGLAPKAPEEFFDCPNTWGRVSDPPPTPSPPGRCKSRPSSCRRGVWLYHVPISVVRHGFGPRGRSQGSSGRGSNSLTNDSRCKHLRRETPAERNPGVMP